jgi:hypothetical protein
MPNFLLIPLRTQYLLLGLFSGYTRTLYYQQLHTVGLQPPIARPLFLLLHYLRLVSERFSCLVCSAIPVKPLGRPEEGGYHFLPLYIRPVRRLQ